MELDTFAHLVAHDLKAPLHGMARIAEIVVEDYGDRLDDDGRAQLALLQSMATHGVALVDALKHFAKASAAPLRPRTVDLATVGRRLLAETASRLGSDATLEAVVADGMPQVTADPLLTNQLLAALFANAAQYSRRPVRRIEFAPCTTPSRPTAAGHVAFTVRDDGIGIPEAQWDAVFDLLKRLHAVDKFGGGAGGGLALARLIVERHGGAIWIDGSSDAGTTVAFTLPARLPAEA